MKMRIKEWPGATLVTILTLLSAFPANASPPIPPEGYPECRRELDGLWYSISWKSDEDEWSNSIRIDGDQIWWSYNNQTRQMALIETQLVRHLYKLNRPFDRQNPGGKVVPTFPFVVVENPMGWLGFRWAETIWPCAITITICRQGWAAYELMEGKPTSTAYASEDCLYDNYVPYQPVFNPDP